MRLLQTVAAKVVAPPVHTKAMDQLAILVLRANTTMKKINRCARIARRVNTTRWKDKPPLRHAKTIVRHRAILLRMIKVNAVVQCRHRCLRNGPVDNVETAVADGVSSQQYRNVRQL